MFNRTMKVVRKNTSDQYHNFPNDEIPDAAWDPAYMQMESHSFIEVVFARWDKERNMHLPYGTNILVFHMDDEEASKFILGQVYELDLG